MKSILQRAADYELYEASRWSWLVGFPVDLAAIFCMTVMAYSQAAWWAYVSLLILRGMAFFRCSYAESTKTRQESSVESRSHAENA